MTALTSGDGLMVVVPIRSGLELRLGANVANGTPDLEPF